MRISDWSSDVCSSDLELQDDMLRIAEIIGALAIVSARQLVGAVPLKSKATLSERQRECVLWTARGKTAAEVAVILGIGEVTVVQHLKTARDRYDVHCGQMRSEEHTSELQSLMRISYAVFCL